MGAAGVERRTNTTSLKLRVFGLEAAGTAGEVAAVVAAPRGGRAADWPSGEEMLALRQIASAERAVRACLPQTAP